MRSMKVRIASLILSAIAVWFEWNNGQDHGLVNILFIAFNNGYMEFVAKLFTQAFHNHSLFFQAVHTQGAYSFTVMTFTFIPPPRTFRSDCMVCADAFIQISLLHQLFQDRYNFLLRSVR